MMKNSKCYNVIWYNISVVAPLAILDLGREVIAMDYASQYFLQFMSQLSLVIISVVVAYWIDHR